MYLFDALAFSIFSSSNSLIVIIFTCCSIFAFLKTRRSIGFSFFYFCSSRLLPLFCFSSFSLLYYLSAMFIVGETIRALSIGGEDCSRRAYISCVNDNGTYDIIYALKSVKRQEHKDEDEECDVPASRIRKLEPFETTTSTSIVTDSGTSEGFRLS